MKVSMVLLSLLSLAYIFRFLICLFSFSFFRKRAIENLLLSISCGSLKQVWCCLNWIEKRRQRQRQSIRLIVFVLAFVFFVCVFVFVFVFDFVFVFSLSFSLCLWNSPSTETGEQALIRVMMGLLALHQSIIMGRELRTRQSDFCHFHFPKKLLFQLSSLLNHHRAIEGNHLMISGPVKP